MASFHAVCFDFGGTLDADGEPVVAQFLRGYRRAGGRRPDADFNEIFRESDRRLAADAGVVTLPFRQTVDVQSRLIAALLDDTERVDPATISTTVAGAAVSIARRNAGVLSSVRNRGVRTAVISNFTGNLELCLAELGLAPVIDVAVDSTVVGVRKPEPRIFQIALERLGVAPEDALMVGDNPIADVGAAAALGMATCWLAPLSRRAPEGCTPTFRIETLTDLPGCIDAPRTTLDADRACTR